METFILKYNPNTSKFKMGWVIRGYDLSQNKLKASQGRSGVSEVPVLGPYLKYCSTTGNQGVQPNHHPHLAQVPWSFFCTLRKWFHWQWSDDGSVEALNSLGFVYVHISCWKYISIVYFGLGLYVLICTFGSQGLTCWTQLCNCS